MATNTTDQDVTAQAQNTSVPAPELASEPAAAPIAAATDTDTTSETDDSALGESDTESYTASLTSSITAYQVEHGRRYHAYQAGRYVLPNDEQEQERLDLQYHALRLAFGDKAYFAPIGDDPKAIMDVGTGTGIWAIDVADIHPDAEIIGTDLSPIQPQWIPPNVKFEVDDAEQTWTYPENHFDLIHTRIMSGSLRNWEKFFETSLKHCRPGGWIECQELDVDARSDDGSLAEDSYIVKWARNQEEAINKVGVTMRLDGSKLKKQLEDAGFVNVTTREFKIPIGTWPADPKMRETGAFQLVAMLDGIQGLTLALWTRFLGWNEQEIEVFLAKARAEWRNRKIHSYWPLYVAYGQKPTI